MFSRKVVSVDEILVNTDVFSAKFQCDLSRCKGACCTIEGPVGAPLLEEEISMMEENLETAKPLLPPEHLQVIQKRGWYKKQMGAYYTNVYNERACVFVYFEEGIAKCAYEKAYFEGRSSFRKPVSCHLFPVRISNFGGEIVRYEKSDVCKPAVETGETNGTELIDFCKDGFVRYFGENWYKQLKQTKVK